MSPDTQNTKKYRFKAKKATLKRYFKFYINFKI